MIHSGVYYKPGSAKAQGCREGIELLNEFCDRHAIPRRPVGKVIVATTRKEVAVLERLYRQGIENGLENLAILDSSGLSRVEPEVTGLGALHIPGVAIVDYVRICAGLRGEIESTGGEVALHRLVDRIEEYGDEVIATTDTGEFRADVLVNCGGLHCDRVAIAAGCEPPVRIVPFRGEYYNLHPSIASRIHGLVYPVPDPRYPFLGVHLTPTMNGEVSAGPNAVLSLAREGYRARDVNAEDVKDMLTWPGFHRMALRHWRTGLFETARSASKRLYLTSVRRFVPNIELTDLLPGGAGVRAQAVDREGGLVHDFLHIRTARCVHVLNAPSPAATASLSIARRIADLACS